MSIKSCAVGWIVTSGEMQLRKPITAAAPARAAKDSKWKGDKRMKKGKKWVYRVEAKHNSCDSIDAYFGDKNRI